jgi:ribosomal protein L40E
MGTCPACGAAVAVDATFCRSCGTRVQAGRERDGTRCSHCQHSNPADSKFCRGCGARLRASVPSVSAPGARPTAQPRTRRKRALRSTGILATALLVVAGGAAAAAALIDKPAHSAARRVLRTDTTRTTKQQRSSMTTGSTTSLTSTQRTGAPIPAPAPRGPSHERTPGPLALGPGEVIRQHFRDIDEGRFSEAFALMAAPYRAHATEWVARHTAAQAAIKLVSIHPGAVSSSAATVAIDFYARDRNPTRGSDTQCREFVGSVNVIKERAGWRYNPALNKLSGRVIATSDPNCPT